MSEGEDLEITQEGMDSLSAKLDAFGQTLTEEERAIVGALLTAGAEAIGSEVTAFNKKGEGSTVDNPADMAQKLSDPIRRYDLFNAWPRK